MANPEDVGILLQGVARWNDWRKDKDGPSLDLSKADLRNRELTGADLRAVNLSGAVLRGAKIGPGSSLWNANLSEADLYGANLRGADLQDVNFSSADLFQTDLRESNLQGADLSTARGGLLSKQLAGSDLTGAKLPEPLAKLYDSLSSVKEISDSAQKLFFALLAGCLYSWLTIAQTTDVELITNRATTPLPIIQAAIPIVGFYVVAPLILLCLYFYFHFYLQKLWDELGSLPAVFTDGRQLHNRTDPWLLNDLVRSHFSKLKNGRPFLSYFQAWVSVVLAWWLVPVTLFFFWVRYLRRHDLFWTVFHALLVALAIFSVVRLYRIAGETLRGHERIVFRWKNVIKRRSPYLYLSFTTILGSVLILISTGAISGQLEFTFRPVPAPFFRPEVPSITSRSPRTWIPSAILRLGYSPFADLNSADVSGKPPDWIGNKEEELDRVKGADLRGRNLRYAQGYGVFLAKADLISSDMFGAWLPSADLRRAILDGSNMERTEMSGASLQNASLHQTRLDYADLRNAHLNGANLWLASMFHANLAGADLSAADLQHVDLRGADLIQANLQGANLLYADLSDVNLDSAEIKYADLQGLQTRLPPESIRKCRNWELALLPRDMFLPLGLPPDHNEKVEQQMCSDSSAVLNSWVSIPCPIYNHRSRTSGPATSMSKPPNLPAAPVRAR